MLAGLLLVAEIGQEMRADGRHHNHAAGAGEAAQITRVDEIGNDDGVAVRGLKTGAQRIEAITHHLESSSRNFDEFTREIRRNPNRLLFTAPADEVE